MSVPCLLPCISIIPSPILWSHTANYEMSNFCANLIQAMNTSYSSTLLVLGKVNRREYSNASPSGGTSTIPAPLFCELDAPSTNNSHSVYLSSPVLLECVYSRIKSAKACPLWRAGARTIYHTRSVQWTIW